MLRILAALLVVASPLAAIEPETYDLRPEGRWRGALFRDGVASFLEIRIERSSSGLRGSVDYLGSAEAALELPPEIDRDRLGAYSISAGGWVAPPVIAESDPLAFWIAKVAPADSVWMQQVRRVQREGHPASRAVVFPGADHGLEVCSGRSDRDGECSWEHLAPGVIETIFEWIPSVLGEGRSRSAEAG